MRVAAKLILLLALAAMPATALAQSKPAAVDAAYARFEAAVADAKSAMMADPEHALGKADFAIARARELGSTQKAEAALATAQWLKGEAYIGINQLDAAAPIVNEALGRAERAAPNTKLHGDLLRSRGSIAAMSGHVTDALADFQEAYRIFQRANELRSQAIILQDIGQIYWDAGDYPKALQKYSEASERYTADPALTLTMHNSVGKVLGKLGRYDEAEHQYQLSLVSARALQSPLLEVRILSNLAAVEVEHGKLDQAQRTVDHAMLLSQTGEAASWRPIALGVAAKVAAARGDLHRAASLLEQTFAGMDLAKTSLEFSEFHQIAASVYERLGNKDLALAHMKAFQRLDSEARNLTATSSSQLMAAQFDSANQNLRISQLKQGQLERDVRIERQQAQFRMIVLIGLIVAGGIVFALLLISSLRIRRSRNEVRAANIVLGETNAALENALKAKTEFLATTSHEIRTPLNGILGMTQILLTNRKIDSEVRDQIQVVHGAGEAMRALVDDILDVAKMETGEVAVASEDTPLRRILEEAARLWTGHAVAKGLALGLDIAEAPSLIRSDGARIRQIVFNLLSNAVKFTPDGSVDLVARAEDGELVIEVRDTGIGIPADQHEKVFEPFHQVDGGTTRQFSGTGLGLAICRNLSGALGGRISVQSELGMGSVFSVRLPLVEIEEASSAGGEAEREAPTELAQSRVLMLESNAMTQGVIRGLLEPVTIQFDCVADAISAIEAVGSGRVDHLLVEARSAEIPGRTPLDSLRSLLEASASAGVPVSVLLAPSEELPLGDVAMLGAAQLILKPIGGAQLVATLKEAYPGLPPAASARSEAA